MVLLDPRFTPRRIMYEETTGYKPLSEEGSPACRMSSDMTLPIRHMIEVPGFEDHNPPQLLIRFGKGAIGNGQLALLEAHRCGCAHALERLPAHHMTVPAEYLVIG